MPTLFDKPYNGTATSKAAADSYRSVFRDEARVLQHLFYVRNDGATDEEMQSALQLDGSTQRPRRIKLFQDGYVGRLLTAEGKPATKATSKGRQAQVWIITGSGVVRVLAETICGAADARAKS